MSASPMESDTSPSSTSDIATLQLAHDLGQPIHDMSPEVTALLAEQGVFTTTEPHSPGSLPEHIRGLRNRRALGHKDWREQQQASTAAHQQLHGEISDHILHSRMDKSRAEHPEPYIPRPHIGKDRE